MHKCGTNFGVVSFFSRFCIFSFLRSFLSYIKQGCWFFKLDNFLSPGQKSFKHCIIKKEWITATWSANQAEKVHCVARMWRWKENILCCCARGNVVMCARVLLSYYDTRNISRPSVIVWFRHSSSKSLLGTWRCPMIEFYNVRKDFCV